MCPARVRHEHRRRRIPSGEPSADGSRVDEAVDRRGGGGSPGRPRRTDGCGRGGRPRAGRAPGHRGAGRAKRYRGRQPDRPAPVRQSAGFHRARGHGVRDPVRGPGRRLERRRPERRAPRLAARRRRRPHRVPALVHRLLDDDSADPDLRCHRTRPGCARGRSRTGRTAGLPVRRRDDGRLHAVRRGILGGQRGVRRGRRRPGRPGRLPDLRRHDEQPRSARQSGRRHGHLVEVPVRRDRVRRLRGPAGGRRLLASGPADRLGR